MGGRRGGRRGNGFWDGRSRTRVGPATSNLLGRPIAASPKQPDRRDHQAGRGRHGRPAAPIATPFRALRRRTCRNLGSRSDVGHGQLLQLPGHRVAQRGRRRHDHRAIGLPKPIGPRLNLGHLLARGGRSCQLGLDHGPFLALELSQGVGRESSLKDLFDRRWLESIAGRKRSCRTVMIAIHDGTSLAISGFAPDSVPLGLASHRRADAFSRRRLIARCISTRTFPSEVSRVSAI